MLRPLDGFIEIDTTNEEMHIELFVVNMAEESEAFKKRINDLEGRISRLKRKNELTQRQLSEIQSQLLDTIMHYENVKQELESEIANYEDLTEEQRREIEEQRSKIEELENQVSQLTYDLEAALEERYLRKNQYFKDISSNLLGYLRKAKDLKDHLPFISTYFTARSFANYERDINGYNEQYEKFDDNKLDYLEGIKHYWENDRLLKKTEELFEYLEKGIHYNQIFKTTVEVMGEVGKQKPKKAQKIATLAHEDLTINLDQLEKDINRLLSDLRKYQ
jgi:outer membrane murein-binding lipoprotein Lpp